MKDHWKANFKIFLSCLILLFLSALLPMFAVSFYFAWIAPSEINLPAIWYAEPLTALHFILVFLLTYGLPGILGVIYLRKYPERVRLYPISFSLIPQILLLAFAGKHAMEILVCGILLHSTLYLTLPMLKPSKRLGTFERISFPCSFTGFLLTGGSACFILAFFLAISSGKAISFLLFPLLTFLGFLLIWYAGLALYKQFHSETK